MYNRANEDQPLVSLTTAVMMHTAGGLGTLTHAETAMPLWREGLQTYLVCQEPVKKAVALEDALARVGSQQLQTASTPDMQGQLRGQHAQVHSSVLPSDDFLTPKEKRAVPSVGFLTPEEMRHMSRSELLHVLHSRLEQHGLTRKQQQKLISSMLRARRRKDKLSQPGDAAFDLSGDIDPVTDEEVQSHHHTNHGKTKGYPRIRRVRVKGPRRGSIPNDRHASPHKGRDDRKAARRTGQLVENERWKMVREAKAEMRRESLAARRGHFPKAKFEARQAAAAVAYELLHVPDPVPALATPTAIPVVSTPKPVATLQQAAPPTPVVQNLGQFLKTINAPDSQPQHHPAAQQPPKPASETMVAIAGFPDQQPQQ